MANETKERNSALILTACEGKAWEFDSSTTFSLTQRFLILKYFLHFSNQCLDFTSDPNAPSPGKGSRSYVPALGAAAAPGAGGGPAGGSWGSLWGARLSPCSSLVHW